MTVKVICYNISGSSYYQLLMDGINERIGSDCKLPPPVGGLRHKLSNARWRAGIYIIITASPTSLPALCRKEDV